jgi:hypothetical protein
MFGIQERTSAGTARQGRPSGPHSWVANLLLAVGSSALVVLAILGAEVVARRVAPDYLIKARGLHVFSGIYGWAGRPRAVAPMGGGRVTLNAQGFRGKDLSPPKGASRTRVVLLGDSIAFGYGVSDEETFAHRLEVEDNGLEVLNLGVEGYGPGQELLLLQRTGLGANPDVVVLAVCLRNDFVDAMLRVALYDGVTPRPRFELVGSDLVLDDSPVRRSAAGHALQWLSDQSHLFNRASAWMPRGREAEDPGWRTRKREALLDEDYAFRLTFALVMEMEKLCRTRGIGFLVATFPNGLGYGIRPEISERFHRSLETSGVALVDMGARFRSMGLRAAQLSIDSTGHLGPRGHALTSEILEQELVNRFGKGVRPLD